jgi:PPOX class probable F420-dependent enzyme
MSREMTHDEWQAVVLEGTRTAKLATSRSDGRPHVAPVWFVLDGDDVIFNTGEASVKGRSLRDDPRVALCVDDETPPFSFLVIEGVAEFSRDLEASLQWATAIGCRYMGAEVAEEFGRRNAVASELLVRVRPTRVIARAGIADCWPPTPTD